MDSRYIPLFIYLSIGFNCQDNNLEAAHAAVSATVVMSTDPVIQKLPAKFQITIQNNSLDELNLNAYDLTRLPEIVLNINFDSPLRKPRTKPVQIDSPSPELRIPPGQRKTLSGYLQQYLTVIPVGRYAMAYTIKWPSLRLNPARNGSADLMTSGELNFTVEGGSAEQIEKYITEHLATIKTTNNPQEAREAAYELSLVDDPAVVGAGVVMAKIGGFAQEALLVAKKFNSAGANQILDLLVNGSINPLVVQGAVAELTQRGVAVRQTSVLSLLRSSNPVTQSLGLQMVTEESDPAIRPLVDSLLTSPELKVRKAAEAADARLRGKEQR